MKLFGRFGLTPPKILKINNALVTCVNINNCRATTTSETNGSKPNMFVRFLIDGLHYFRLVDVVVNDDDDDDYYYSLSLNKLFLPFYWTNFVLFSFGYYCNWFDDTHITVSVA